LEEAAFGIGHENAIGRVGQIVAVALFAFAQGFLGLLARGDVADDEEHAEGPVGLVADELAVDFDVELSAIIAEGAVFAGSGKSALEHAGDVGGGALPVGRGDEIEDGAANHGLIGMRPEHLLGHRGDHEDAPIQVRDGDVVGGGVEDGAVERLAFAQGGLRAFEVGDVVEEDSELPGLRPIGGDLVVSAQFTAVVLEGDGFAGEGHLAEAFDPEGFGLGKHVAHGPADQRVRLEAGERLERRVDLEKTVIARPAGVVDDDFMEGEAGTHGREQELELPFAVLQRGLGLLLLGDIDGIARQQGLAFADDREFDRGVVAAMEFFLQLQHLSVGHDGPVVGGDLGGEFGGEQFRHGLAAHLGAGDADHLLEILAGLQDPALGGRDFLDEGVDGRVAHEEREHLLAFLQGGLGAFPGGDVLVDADEASGPALFVRDQRNEGGSPEGVTIAVPLEMFALPGAPGDDLLAEGGLLRGRDGSGEIPVGPAQDLVRGVAVELLGAVVPKEDLALQIGSDDGFPDAFEQLGMEPDLRFGLLAGGDVLERAAHLDDISGRIPDGHAGGPHPAPAALGGEDFQIRIVGDALGCAGAEGLGDAVPPFGGIVGDALLRGGGGIARWHAVDGGDFVGPGDASVGQVHAPAAEQGGLARQSQEGIAGLEFLLGLLLRSQGPGELEITIAQLG
jgi:hypothetical protein